MHGGTGTGGANFSVIGYKSNTSEIFENGLRKKLNTPQSHIYFSMPKNGCIPVEKMRSDLTDLGFNHTNSSVLANASDYFSKEKENVEIKYFNYNIQKGLGPNPKNNRCVNRLLITGEDFK